MYTQLEQRGMTEPPVTVASLQTMKESGEPIGAIQAYVKSVKDRSYPAPEHCFS